MRERVVPNEQTSIEVEGSASVFAGSRALDVFIVLAPSKSLRKTDPEDQRSSGALALVRLLSWSDTHFGVVDFDRNAKLVLSLTGNRSAVIRALQGLDQNGFTNLAGGIRTPL